MERVSLVRLMPRRALTAWLCCCKRSNCGTAALRDASPTSHLLLDLAVSRGYSLTHGTRTFPTACREQAPRMCAAKPCFSCPRKLALPKWSPDDHHGSGAFAMAKMLMEGMAVTHGMAVLLQTVQLRNCGSARRITNEPPSAGPCGLPRILSNPWHEDFPHSMSGASSPYVRCEAVLLLPSETGAPKVVAR